MRRIILVAFLLCITLSGCNQCSNLESMAPTRDPMLGEIMYIEWNDYPYVNDDMFCKFGWKYTIANHFQNPALQQEVSRIQVEFPIHTDEEASNFAWSMYDLLVANDFIEKEFSPKWIECYTDGVIYIGFSVAYFDNEGVEWFPYDAKAFDILISAIDGHVIHFGTLDSYNVND